MPINLVAGDTGSILQVTCTRVDGSVIDLTGATVQLFWRATSGPPQKRTMTVVHATNGIVSYQFQAGELVMGGLVGEIEIDFPDTTVLTSALSFSIPVRMRTYGSSRPS
jgi:BppU N-terminal domain